MGGSGGGSIPGSDLKQLEEKAKQVLKSSASETSRHIFISFAFENENEVNLLRAQAKNDRTDLQFDDFSLKDAINSGDDEYIKRVIRERINRVSVTAVYSTPDSANSKWVDWEIKESLRRGKGVIGFYKGDAPPTNLPASFKANRCKVVKWETASLMKAIENAFEKR